MADLSDLKLRNTAGSTVSDYSLINDHADAIEAISKKPFVYTTTAGNQTVTPVDGGVYLIKGVGAGDVRVSLPLSSENVGMVVFAKLPTLTAGTGTVDLVDEDDKLDNVTNGSVDLAAAGDYVEVIATATGWFSMAKYLAADDLIE